MAFDINRFQKKYKEMAEDNRLLKECVTTFEGRQAQAVKLAEQAAIAPLHQEIQHLRAAIAHAERLLQQGKIDRQQLADAIVVQDAVLVSAKKDNDELQADVKLWQGKHAEQLPAVTLMEQQLHDLTLELKRHEDKMSRRERERLSAIENRKVLAQVVPARRRA